MPSKRNASSDLIEQRNRCREVVSILGLGHLSFSDLERIGKKVVGISKKNGSLAIIVRAE